MSIFASPEELAADLSRGIRRLKGISADTIALLEADAAREARQLRMIRQVAFLVFVWPLVFAIAACAGAWVAAMIRR